MADDLAPLPATVDGMGAANAKQASAAIEPTDAAAEALAAEIVKGRKGAAGIALEQGASVALRARAIAADTLVAEAQAIVDAPFLCDPSEMSAEGARAERRAKYRWDRARALARATYGDQQLAPVNVQVNVAFGSLASQVSAAADNRDFVPVQRKRDEGQ